MRKMVLAALVSTAAHAAMIVLSMSFLLTRSSSERTHRAIELASVERPPLREEKKTEAIEPVQRTRPKRIIKKVQPQPHREAPPDEPPPASEEPQRVGIDAEAVSDDGSLSLPTGAKLDGEIGTGTSKEGKNVQAGVPGGRGRGASVPIYAVTRLPRAKWVIEPRVPESFRTVARDVVVVVEVEIDVRGHVVGARVVRKAGFGLDEAALFAAKSTEFEPALVGEQPVPVRYQIPYRFRVRG